MRRVALFSTLLLFSAALSIKAAEPSGALFLFNKETLGPEWETQGDVSLMSGDSFRRERSLRLSRGPDQAHLPVNALSPEFSVAAGFWEITAAGKVEIYSPDNSFNGKIWLVVFDRSGAQIDRLPIGDFSRQKEWIPLSRRIELPRNAGTARFFVEMNKTYGSFLVEELSAAFRGAGRRESETVDRILFSSAQPGNLLYPRDPRTVTVLVETFRPLADTADREVTLEVLDYWGAEQSAPLTAWLRKLSENSYEAVIDLAGIPLQEGRYYELHASVPQLEGPPAQNYTSLAILPEAPNKRLGPDQIPFTARNWDNRIAEYYPLADRLGIRICGIWGRFSPDPPYAAQAPRIDIVKDLGMGALTTTPIFNIEHQRPGWEKYDEKALREGTRNLINTIGAVRPLVINLGNEPPHHSPEVIERAVAAYRIVYDEIKKIDPSILVLGSSAGPQEEFFREGFGEWCDAYDFHTYNDPASVRNTIRRYQALFQKYGHAKPIWSTEIGLNSQGLERRAVAVDMIKKITGFFAEGGANISWFGILYPDPNLKLHGGSEDAHNVFDCRYARYAPKLDALTYYFMANGIGIKKFVAEKTYAEGVYSALFRDRNGKNLQVLWKESGDSDIYFPLKGAGNVRTIRIDGSVRYLDACGAGVTISVGTDPVLLEYESASASLPEALGEPAALLERVDGELVLGATSSVSIRPMASGINVALSAPPFWKSEDRNGQTRLTPPRASRVREAVLSAILTDANGRIVGELHRRLPVAGKLSLRLLPEAATLGGEPGIRLVLANKGGAAEEVAWSAELTGELALEEGVFGPLRNTARKLSGPVSGTITLTPGQTESILLALPGAEPAMLYQVRATASYSEGAVLSSERYVGGFVGVPNVSVPPVVDGALDESGWRTAPAITVDRIHHFCPLREKTASWTGAADLSARARFLWDTEFLYMGIEVEDDIAGALKQDEAIWSQDGLQFLIDPARESKHKAGKYDYAVALGAKGPQAWCYLTASPAQAPVGEVVDFRIGVKRSAERSGHLIYEVAIPWRRIAPFRAEPGANLGLTVIFNEDDGQGRDSFLALFGNAHTKQVDTAGDLILLPATSPP